MKQLSLVAVFLATLVFPPHAWPVVFASLRGVVHDPDHRPVNEAVVVVKSTTSDYSQNLTTGPDGGFETASVPLGAYTVTVTRHGFETSAQQIVLSSGNAPVLHFQLTVGSTAQSVTVEEQALAANPETMTPNVIISRKEIQSTPGADLSNNMNMITDYVPGARMTHDQLHVRGGHQVSWAIAAGTRPRMATARTASSTWFRAPALSATTKRSSIPPTAPLTRPTISSTSAATPKSSLTSAA